MGTQGGDYMSRVEVPTTPEQIPEVTAPSERTVEQSVAAEEPVKAIDLRQSNVSGNAQNQGNIFNPPNPHGTSVGFNSHMHSTSIVNSVGSKEISIGASLIDQEAVALAP